MHRKFLFIALFCFVRTWAQDTLALREVVVDKQLRKYSAGQELVRIPDSVIRKNPSSLTDLLRNETPVYFKENGYGMVSSPAFRGTAAAQTAVTWNGININSAFTGQTDFNTLATGNFTAVSVRPGGGSVLYGSSAIGGSIHLEDALAFEGKFMQEIAAAYGSFNTENWRYHASGGNEKLAVSAGASGMASDNDYTVGRFANENGQYRNIGFDAAAACRIDSKNTVSLYGYAFDGMRHFSLISPSDTRSKYRDSNMRNLVSWEYRSNRFTSTLKAAYLTEHYRYYQFPDTPDPDDGKAETALLRYEVGVALSKKSRLDGVVQYDRTLGYGSNVARHLRETVSGALLWAQEIRKLHLELGLRQEITATYDSPLLFSAALSHPLGKTLEVKAGVSRNFRIPTFNDLYWSEGGNPNLRPEDALQYQSGVAFKSKNFEAAATLFLIDIKDMIQWLPGTTTFWLPQNVGHARSYGGEAFVDFHKDFGKTRIQARGSYGYTISGNRNTGKLLIYVPKHRGTASVGASRSRVSAGIQGSFTDQVFTRSDNNPRYNLDGYAVCDGDVHLGIGKSANIVIGAQIRNIFDTRYAVVEGRPFPGRNYQLYINVTL